MRVTVITPPEPVVTWADADAHLHLGGDTSQRGEVEAMIAAATATLDAPNTWLGRALGRQTLEARLDWFDPCGIRLWFAPVVTVLSVMYLDTSNAEQTLAADQYELIGDRLMPAWSASWPETLARPEAVRVSYIAGYEMLPFPIRAAILLMVGDLYRFRETAMMVSGMAVPMSATVETLLAPYRVYG